MYHKFLYVAHAQFEAKTARSAIENFFHIDRDREQVNDFREKNKSS